MMQTLSIFAAGLALVRAIPQSNGVASLPQCGQQCVNAMIGKATTEFGCSASNLTECACCNVNFGYGIRDCSRAVCGGENADYSSVISYGLAYCSTAVSSCPSASGAASSASGGGSGSGSSATGSGSGAGATGIGALVAAGVAPASGVSNAYVLGGSTTISAGGNAATISGAQITALPSGQGIDVSAGSIMTTIPASVLAAGAGAGAGAGGLAALAGAVAAVSGASNEYVVAGSNTISAGGSAFSTSGAVFTALPSGGGVDVSANSAQTTLDAATVSGGSGSGAAGAAGLAGLAGAVAAVSGASNEYVVGGSNTISAGGSAFSTSGAVYTALPSGGGVDVSANGAMTTVDAATASGGAGGAGGSGGSSSGGSGGSTGSGGSGGESTASGSGGAATTTSSALGVPMKTAAPALIGAAAMAILAL